MSDKITDERRCYSEKAMAPHSSTLAWKIPWMEEPGGLPSMGHAESDMTEATQQQQQQMLLFKKKKNFRNKHTGSFYP